MVSHHRGHEITVTREKCLGGWPLLYFHVFRESDGYLCVDGFEDSAETVRDKVKQMKERINAELAEDDPWNENGTYDIVEIGIIHG